MEDTFRIFVSIAAAIFLEAMPFLALGSLLSAMVEVFVNSERLAPAGPAERVHGHSPALTRRGRG